MNKEELKLALEALEWATSCISFEDFDDMPEAMAELEKAHRAIKALEEALKYDMDTGRMVEVVMEEL